MSISKRKFLGIIGGGVIFGATTGAGTFLLTRTPDKALAPWKKAGLAGGYIEPRRRALSFAILAPNPHNRQPWLVDLSQADKIMLYVDTDKLLPHTDPFNRQITIGLGCFLELLRMAGAQQGYRVSIDGFPAGFDNRQLDKRPVAEISFVKDDLVPKDPLFEQVLERRSMKEPFDLDRQVPDDVLENLKNVVHNGISAQVSNDPSMVKKLRALTHQAMAIEIETPRTYKESVDLFRIGKREVNANPDGIDFSGPKFDSLAALGMFSREIALDTTTSAYKQGIAAVMAPIDTAMGYVWLMTQTNTRSDQLNAGRDWLRVNLAATAKGVGLQPLSQCLQEYREMTDKYDEVHHLLKTYGRRVQMLGRLGYAAPVAPSPRWPLEAKIIKA